MEPKPERQARVVFTPSGRRGEFPLGTPLLEAAWRIGVDVASICGGRGLCGRCRVVCSAGDFPKHGIVSSPEHLSPAGAVETRYGERGQPLSAGHRLSCQATIQGDLVIDVPPESQVHRQLVRKAADSRPIRLDPVVRLYLVDVPAADLGSGSDLTRLLDALQSQWNLRPAFPAALLPDLQGLLRTGGWSVTVAVHQDADILAVWPGFKEAIYGVAVDVGSTTIAAHLCDLGSGDVLSSNGMMNPQIRFGEDLMSRVSYVMMHPEGSEELTREVRRAVNELVLGTAADAGIEAQDIVSLTFVCNPIMHHLLLGISPVELGGAPFALAAEQSVHLPARDLGVEVNPGAVAYALPCIAGHVGADTAGVMLCEQPHRSDAVSLLVDIGTNAEIVLGNDARLLACSSPTGPAFEGAQVSAGQRAAPGAIERVRIDPVTLETRIRVIGSDLWSDEPGFGDALPAQGVTGICGSGIIEAVVEMWLAGVLTSDGVIDGDQASRTPRLVRDGRTFSFVICRPDRSGGDQVTVTQNDVRQIQLAKAALYAGIRLLMDRLEVTSVDRIRLAGAFGSHIDVRYAMALGMIPNCALDAVSAVGNAAGHGARIALLNKGSRREIESVVKGVEKVETATEPKFQQYFVDAMAIPHGPDDMARRATLFPGRVTRVAGTVTERPSRARGRRSKPRTAPPRASKSR
ncbi:MAG: ASKHA domain-containing protein [Gammaproteobacteria bacterium]|nr:ASKHA domain-containing protein [Gammaproteobacteria bacterium]